MSRASQDRIADANTLATEALGAVRTVQAHSREGYERGRYAQAMATAVATARKRIGAQATVTAIAISLIFGAVILVLWSGAHDVIKGQLSAGALGQFVMYAMIGGGSVGALAEVWNELQKAAGGMGRIHELLQEQSSITAPAQPQPLPTPVPVSYTHLDVYKRQPLCHRASRARPASTGPGCHDPVSYTHLDVYKRQICASSSRNCNIGHKC